MIGPVGLFGLTLALRLGQHHSALLYPDGYQYLLMARGISEHFQPTTVMGPGGDMFAPSPDAAVKPLFPLLVAATHALGLSWLGAAEAVTAIAAAATVALTLSLVLRLTGSWLGAVSAAVLLLASSTLAYWSSFAGPDPLAQALGLGAALAFVGRRPALGGVLTGLAVSARPELALLLLAGVVVWGRSPEHRRAVGRAGVAAGVTLALVFGALRPPIALPETEFLLLLPLLLGLVVLGRTIRPGRAASGCAAAGLIVVTALAFATAPGLGELWHEEWPLLVLAMAGLAVAILTRKHRSLAAHVLVAALLLGVVYWAKNPALARYFTIVLPLAAILVGVGVAELERWRPRLLAPALAAITVAAVAGLLDPSTADYDRDVFARTAMKLSPALVRSDPLVTAAPDAYSFWLPGYAIRTMRPGARGLVVLDSAQRAYAPGLEAEGEVVARLATEFAFVRPDGEVDAGDVVLVAGRVVDGQAADAVAARTLRVKPRAG
jgi:hypothetical protein